MYPTAIMRMEKLVKYLTAALAVSVLVLSACTGAGAAPTTEAVPSASPKPAATPTNSPPPTASPEPTETPTAEVDPEKAAHIVAFLDGLPDSG